MAQPAPGLIVAAPASGCGKTTVTLALLRHFRNAGIAVGSVKVGPDYIDPAFHSAASGRPCHNLDGWAMREATFGSVLSAAARDAALVIGEGVMGLFDGAPDGTGSTADVAAAAGWPILLVVDVRGQAASAAALVHGFASYRADVAVAGVVFNRVGGAGHVRTLERAMAGLGLPVLGTIPAASALSLPERHLGLVQAAEHAALDRTLDDAAAFVAGHLDMDGIRDAARQARAAPGPLPVPFSVAGRRVAVARDTAFAFTYASLLEGWRAAGTEVVTFSPLADEPPPEADLVYLPGGYPELHAERLSGNRAFLVGLRDAARRGAALFGECGGYMVLGEGLVDAEGRRHAMAGLLPVETSFAERRLHLGYREVTLLGDGPLGQSGAAIRGHEFHYARLLREDGETPLFACRDALGEDLGAVGCRRGNVMGSFIHLIDATSEEEA